MAVPRGIKGDDQSILRTCGRTLGIIQRRLRRSRSLPLHFFTTVLLVVDMECCYIKEKRIKIERRSTSSLHYIALTAPAPGKGTKVNVKCHTRQHPLTYICSSI